MKKIVVLTNIPAPPQVKWVEYLGERYDVSCLYTTAIGSARIKRPQYWEIDLPSNFYFTGSSISFKEINFKTNVLSLLRKINPDILLISSPWFGLESILSYLWARSNGKKIIMGPMEFSESSYKLMKILRNKFIYGFLYSRVSLFLANGYMHLDYLKMALGQKRAEIFVNYDDYEAYINHPIREKKDKVVFMYGGRSDENFRIHAIIDAFEKLLNEFPFIELNISSFGDKLEKYKSRVSNSECLSKSVTFIKNKSWDDVEKVFARSDVLINFANFSPGGGVILSAVASGMGIISSIGVHAYRSYTVSGYNAFVVSEEKGLYDAMRKYITSNALQEHSARNKKVAKSTLLMKHHLDEFDELISIHLQ